MKAESEPWLVKQPSLRRLVLAAACALAGCSGDAGQRAETAAIRIGEYVTSSPLAERGASNGPLFESLAAERTGVDFASDFDWEHPLRHLFEHGFAGGGVAIGDVDGNGLPDIYLTGRTRADALYRQTGSLEFEDITRAAGIDHGVTWGAGAAFADVDGDGDLDLYVCNYDAPNLLYLNRGDGTFEERAQERGVAFHGASVMASFADYDSDGNLDLYLVTNRMYPGPGKDVPRTRTVDGKIEIEPGSEDAYEIVEATVDGELQKYVGKCGQPDRLLRNDGTGRFDDVTEQAGVWHRAAGLSATWWDHDGDGFPDLYVGNDYFGADRLFHNQGDGTFRDECASALPHTPWFTMGAAAGDLDSDGRLDLVAADMSATTHYRSKIMMGDMADSRWFLTSAEPRQYMRNAVFRNTGTPRFMEVAYLAGLASTDWTWSVKLADLDCDGHVDAYFTNGSANNTFEPDLGRELRALQRRLAVERRPLAERLEEEWKLYRTVPPRREQNLAFRNEGELMFTDASRAWGLDDEVISYGAALSDLDRDGDLDLVVNNLGGSAAVYRNNGMHGHRVLVRLRGTASHAWGIGARVEALAGGVTRVRELAPTSGYMSADEPLIQLGLGDAESIERLTVRWPSGVVQALEHLEVDRFYTITEPPESDPLAQPAVAKSRPRFTDETLALGIGRGDVSEEPFDDYARQPLLPAGLSQLGPGMAWGDANGDGEEDLFVGGSAGRSGLLITRRRDGTFRSAPGAWAQDAACEDMAPLFLDTDSDGDLDLFVASGGIECEPGAAVLRDRLYLNTGDGTFVRAPATDLPDVRASSSAVAAADLDGDGDVDLFVGARSIPGAYPLAPESTLLVNERGRFRDATDELAPGLRRVGMVTSALWSDVDGDGRPDLAIALEWGPVALWMNTGGRLEGRTAEAGLGERTGWWTSLASGDLDGDGDADLVALNAGLNTKYHASSEKPALLYYGDLDGSGVPHLVEAKRAEAGLLPVRGLSCSSSAMPSIAERMPSFDAFARAALPDIYPSDELAAATRFAATELASGVLINAPGPDGIPRFDWRPLPRIAQASPGKGVVVGDFDGDGDEDLYLIQNSFQREPETGRWDSGVSLLLDGDGSGGFRAIEPSESGLVVAGDGTSLTTCDLNRDGNPDFVAAQNEGPLLAFQNARRGACVSVRLKGAPGNPTCIGARLTVLEGPGAGRTLERRAGSGYLSQSSAELFLGVSKGGEPLRVRVRWPDGVESTHAIAPDLARVTLERP